MADARKVFLSYSHDEVPFVRAVAERLRQRGVEAWHDEFITPGAEWGDTLQEALSSSTFVIVFVSDAALASPSINFEIGAAVGRGKRVVPVFLTQAARRHAPHVLSSVAGIDAHDMKPHEVAEQIADALAAA